MKSALILVSLITTVTLTLTGCNLKLKKVGDEVERPYKPVVEYLYDDANAPISNISDKYSNELTITQDDINKIPEKNGENIIPQNIRESYAKQAKEVAAAKELTDNYISVLYNINADNVSEQCEKLSKLSIDEVKTQYEGVKSEVIVKKIHRDYVDHKIDKNIKIDVKLLSNGDILPGKIVYGIITYKTENGDVIKDNLELKIVNRNGQWLITSFKVIQ